MPELPEVETIRRQLEQRLTGRTIRRLRVWDPMVVSPYSASRLARRIAGRRIERVSRRGKYLRLELEGVPIAFLHGDDKKLMNEIEASGDFDFLFYGHTHQAAEHRTDGL